MKVTRKMLLIITASLGVLIIVYSLVRQFFGIGLSEKLEKYMFDVVVIGALGCFMYNRKLAKDERQAREEAQKAAAEAERRALNGEEEPEEEEASSNDDNIPHWERHKNTPQSIVEEEEDEEGEEIGDKEDD